MLYLGGIPERERGRGRARDACRLNAVLNLMVLHQLLALEPFRKEKINNCCA